MHRFLLIVFVCLFVAGAAAAQEFPWPQETAALADQVIAVYKDADRVTYLDNLYRLQIVAGHYADAAKSLAELRGLRSNPAYIEDQLFTRVKGDRVQVAEAFRETMQSLDDHTSALAIRIFQVTERFLRADVDAALAAQKGKTTISLAAALALVRAQQIDDVARFLGPSTASLVAEDDQRRYVFENDIAVKSADGATICAKVARPRNSSGRLPALLEFTIYNYSDPNLALRDLRRTASNGYVGVVGYSRGKGCSPDKTVPYEHEGADAATLIDWITKQSWSDGRVGMYGGSYSGFTAWAATKFMPKGLKAIMIGAAAAPAIDVPMERSVVWNFVYPWPFYTTDNKVLDDDTYNNSTRWQKLDRDYYTSGRAYRDLEKIDGKPNPIFDRWIAHPSYDSYWQQMLPYRDEFARIGIPVLSTAGYFAGGPGAAVYYFTQHLRYRPDAEDYLVIGPYDHFEGQRGVIDAFGKPNEMIAGYKRDAAAFIDFTALRYQWFDYVFKGAPKPELLQDHVNYEVTGANVWKHAKSIEAMSGSRVRFYIASPNHLATSKPENIASFPLTVNFADRSDADRLIPGGGLLDKEIDQGSSLTFISDPLPKAVEMSGLFSGQLDFVTNKKDFDFNIALYEQTADGKYFQLAPYWSRASYERDRTKRHLLTPGKRTRLDFGAVRLMSHVLAPNSRLVVVLGVIKQIGVQLNYGSGKNVSDETIADAKTPLRIRWYNDTYMEVPYR
jgi:putative CocE/NonD family hydrolase